MAKRLDLLALQEEAAAMEAEEDEMWELACQRTQKAVEWVVTERLAGRVVTGTTAAYCWAAKVLATAGPPPSLGVLRSDKVIKEEKAAEEMAQPPVEYVGREDSQAPDAAAAQIGQERRKTDEN